MKAMLEPFVEVRDVYIGKRVFIYLYILVAMDTVRLVGGSRDTEGRVEVKINEVWGSVCDSGWSLPEGDVICRQLGYPRASQVLKGAWFGKGLESS